MRGFELFKVSDKEVGKFDRSLNAFVSALKFLKTKYPNLSNEELLDLYKQKNLEFLNMLIRKKSVRSDTFRLNAINQLLDSPYHFKTVYNEVIRDAAEGKIDLTDISGLSFTLNKEDCQRTHVIDSIYAARKIKSDFLTSTGMTEYRLSKVDVRAIKRAGTMNKDALQYLTYIKQSELDRVIQDTKAYKTNFEKELRENYISTLVEMFSHFKELGYIDKYIANHNVKNPKELHFTMEDLDAFFNQESLDKLNLTELAGLYSFYSNRYTKELQDLEIGNFCLISGYSLDELMEAEDPSKVIPEIQKKPLIKEKEFLTTLTDSLLAREYAAANAKQTFTSPDTYYQSNIDLAALVDEKKEYKDMFGKNQRTFYSMLSKVFAIRNHTRNQYISKDYSLLSTLSTLVDPYSKVKNWGIILDEDETADKNFVLLGFDIKGFNMPLRLHVPKDTLKDFAREYLNSEYVPVYEGDSDFSYACRKLSTPVLTKAPEKFKTYLQEKVSTINKAKPQYSNDRFYCHLLSLIDESADPIPDHLKTPVMEGKKGKKKEKLKHIKRYYSVKTGEVINERQFHLKEK